MIFYYETEVSIGRIFIEVEVKAYDEDDFDYSIESIVLPDGSTARGLDNLNLSASEVMSLTKEIAAFAADHSARAYAEKLQGKADRAYDDWRENHE